MLLHIGKLAVFKHGRGHIGVLDAIVGQNGGREVFVQVHTSKAFRVFPGNLVPARPERLLLLVTQAVDPVPELLRPVQKDRQGLAGQGVRVRLHLLGRGDDDSHDRASSI